ncbi:hypothetical protein ABVT39_009668 [Epinephelus coioides]
MFQTSFCSSGSRQEAVTKLSEDEPDDAGGKSAASGVRKDIRTKKENQQQRRVFCEKCNKGFHYRHHLKQHMSCHDKPFSCDQCDKRFHREKTLQTHLQRHKVKQQERSKCCRAAAVTDSSDSKESGGTPVTPRSADVL